ncbi:unnamed protein product [Polarella glacialis]|uniref:Uncharacterized protein n=1 Tax=Polarella glacialis TaxID=89957 RepID=A0A813GHG0_POLGL|nr:unnamed protein product [Polarella glacialis]
MCLCCWYSGGLTQDLEACNLNALANTSDRDNLNTPSGFSELDEINKISRSTPEGCQRDPESHSSHRDQDLQDSHAASLCFSSCSDHGTRALLFVDNGDCVNLGTIPAHPDRSQADEVLDSEMQKPKGRKARSTATDNELEERLRLFRPRRAESKKQLIMHETKQDMKERWRQIDSEIDELYSVSPSRRLNSPISDQEEEEEYGQAFFPGLSFLTYREGHTLAMASCRHHQHLREQLREE